MQHKHCSRRQCSHRREGHTKDSLIHLSRSHCHRSRLRCLSMHWLHKLSNFLSNQKSRPSRAKERPRTRHCLSRSTGLKGSLVRRLKRAALTDGGKSQAFASKCEVVSSNSRIRPSNPSPIRKLEREKSSFLEIVPSLMREKPQ